MATRMVGACALALTLAGMCGGANPSADEPAPPVEPDDGATARINLRLPEQLKAGAEQAATREGLSVNSWLVRAVAAALTNRDPGRAPQRGGRVGESFTGWVR